jgi:solute carrier family 6 amino acid/orphan transporter-like 15/16/17/18/20
VFRPEGDGEEREQWDSKLTVLLAAIGYADGLGNIWHFQYLAENNGVVVTLYCSLSLVL